MTNSENPIENRLLAALADADWHRWKPQLECVDLEVGQVLYEPGRAQQHAYFPTGAIVSLAYISKNGHSIGISVVGREGFIGVPLILGDTFSSVHGSVLIAGQSIRIGAQMFREQFDRSDSMRRLLLRYVQTRIAQVAQSAICHRLHTVEQHLGSWLLHAVDCLRDSDVPVTQELIANMLGVRRESVTQAAGQLQAAGLIRCTRGHIMVLDCGGLERRSCECHAVVKEQYDRLLARDHVADRPRRAEGPCWQRIPAAQAHAMSHRQLGAVQQA